ncbi:MAG: energy-coupling factor transporter transmembrane component T [Methanomicrobiales archaeon]|nr:energy-coupling factor transporter transmembrane component T [Methanomicrobiales archaeon]
MIQEHMPDLGLITYYAERGQSPLSAVSPWTKLISLVLLVSLITVSSDMTVMAALFGVVLLMFFLAGLPVRKLFAWFLLPLLFVVSLVGIMIWFQPGLPLFSFGIAGVQIALTDRGAGLFVTLVFKALASFTFTLLFLMTTRYEHLAGMIQRIFPHPLNQIFLLAYRFIFITLAMIGSMVKALRSRGGGILRSLMMSGSLIPELFAITIIRSLERGERVQKAMMARGYRGTLTADVTIPRPGLIEYSFLGFFALIVILAGMNSVGWGSI